MMTDESFKEIGVQELQQRLTQDSSNLQLIDVREPQEVAIAQISGFVNLPLSEYDQWQGEISARFDTSKETLVLCHHGSRSAQMCQWLLSQGFTDVSNIVGGIDAYSLLVDNSIPRY
ncbi:MAG: hypothetical protein RLZZ29_1737 [Cyanobacteriota bacterium]